MRVTLPILVEYYKNVVKNEQAGMSWQSVNVENFAEISVRAYNIMTTLIPRQCFVNMVCDDRVSRRSVASRFATNRTPIDRHPARYLGRSK